MGAKLVGANLREADLREAKLREADLWGADLREANLGGAKLEGANVISIVYSAVDTNDGGTAEYTGLRETHFLTQEQLNSMNGDSGTLIPDDLTRPTHWSDLEEVRSDELPNVEAATGEAFTNSAGEHFTNEDGEPFTSESGEAFVSEPDATPAEVFANDAFVEPAPFDAQRGPDPTTADISVTVQRRTRAELRAALTQSYPDARALSQGLAQQLQREIALHAMIPTPNTDEALSEHNARGNFLDEMLIAVTMLHEALPDTPQELDQDETIDTIKSRLLVLAAKCQETVAALDNSTGTPGNLWKLGIITACSWAMSPIVPVAIGAPIAAGVVGASTFRVIWTNRDK